MHSKANDMASLV